MKQNIKNKYTNTNLNLKNVSLYELYIGQPIVHVKYGVGRYDGMKTLEINGIKMEYLIIRYFNNDKLYVPISSLYLIDRYIGSTKEQIPLHKLGNNIWIRLKKKVLKRIQDISIKLLNFYAKRIAKKGYSFQYNKKEYKSFCEKFPYEETPDQKNAMDIVLYDMLQPFSMDRLICGDVGFGKTEIAMRAAFIAIQNNKQVAVLVPTTLLAQQHFYNFKNRFSNWPICVEMISRFCNKKEQNRILKNTHIGEIDILIGTHKLLQRDVKWKRLGLLIIDEEQRFGVRHKEQIRSIRENIDMLTLTATPIPRTLNMAIHGIRDLSIISTPPAKRKSIKTFVCEYDKNIICEAISREIFRNGQVYYLCNDINFIEKTAFSLKKMLPNISVSIAHGKMKERDLKQVMDDFYHKLFNVLVCTTIIETGIDIANVNTIIIERADRFGLGQLYQLRGRVGRSCNQAYSYLLIPSLKELSKNASKRLEAIVSLETLGSGFSLATHDLEIRGPGALFGEDQSGDIQNIGFSLYMNLLRDTIDTLKNGKKLSLNDILNQQDIEIELGVPAFFPEDYISNVNIRLSLYKKISDIKKYSQIEKLKKMIINCFGPLPKSAEYLFSLVYIREKAKFLKIKKIKSTNRDGLIEFYSIDHINFLYLIKLIKKYFNRYYISNTSMELKFIHNYIKFDERLHFINILLDKVKKNISFIN
ncbi:MAG: transcription-repair coupling factor [Candidatus Westeberhardia cardiocondylae]|nr:transcription-repair coupling factor [Candidatus Westeberhardia cardiocondylae]